MTTKQRTDREVERESLDAPFWLKTETVTREWVECGVCKRRGMSKEDVEHSESCPHK